jgi:hypothetical protein
MADQQRTYTIQQPALLKFCRLLDLPRNTTAFTLRVDASGRANLLIQTVDLEAGVEAFIEEFAEALQPVAQDHDGTTKLLDQLEGAE